MPDVEIPIDGAVLEGQLKIPKGSRGLVIFVHGSGSSRFSPRNVFVARELEREGMATLLIDLLTEREDEAYEMRFDIDLLTERLERIVSWLTEEKATTGFTFGLFGASTGSAAALKTAAQLGGRVAAIVSRGGRPDLVLPELGAVVSPTLLIVGGEDFEVLELNKRALAQLSCEKKMEIIPGATHLFEEEGTLERVAELSAAWFKRFFAAKRKPRSAKRPGEKQEVPEAEIPPRFENSAEKPTRPPDKVRGGAKEGYRALHRR